GTPYQYTDREQHATGVLPQLLNSIDEKQTSAFVSDIDWCMQEKKDGRRMLLKKEDEAIIGINRHGLASSLPSTIVQSATTITDCFILYGECVGDVLYVFDLLRRGDESVLVQHYRVSLNHIYDIQDSSDLHHTKL